VPELRLLVWGELMSNPDLASGALAKPLKGSGLLDKRARRARQIAHEQLELQAALKRDHRKCRWPNCKGTHKGLSLPIDPCHLRQPDGGPKHRGSGGNPDGSRTDRRYVAALCRRHHGLYDAGEIDIVPLTDAGADDVLAFYAKHPETGQVIHVATEQRIGVSVTR
jgi:hypothetical protein